MRNILKLLPLTSVLVSVILLAAACSSSLETNTASTDSTVLSGSVDSTASTAPPNTPATTALSTTTSTGVVENVSGEYVDSMSGTCFIGFPDIPGAVQQALPPRPESASQTPTGFDFNEPLIGLTKATYAVDSDGDITPRYASTFAAPETFREALLENFGGSRTDVDSNVEMATYDDEGNELTRQEVTFMVTYDDYIEAEAWEPEKAGDIEFALLDDPSIDRVAIFLAGNEAWSMTRSVTAPTIQATIEGSVLSWNITDPEGLETGAAFNAIIIQQETGSVESFPIAPLDSSEEIDLAELPVSGLNEPSIIQIMATDGLNTAIMRLDAGIIAEGARDCVTVSADRPVILWGEGGTGIELDAYISLPIDGYSSGCDDECLKDLGVQIWWHSDIDGELATTRDAYVGAPDKPLTKGNHVLTITVAWNGLWDSDSIAVEVEH